MEITGNVTGAGRGLLILVGTLIVLWMISPFAVIPAGHRGVVTTFGKVDTVPLDEGLHLIVPIVNSVTKIDVRVMKSETEGDAASRDLQQVTTKIALNYHLQPSKVALTFQGVGLDVEAKIIDPAVEEAFKAVTAQYTAEELITKREDVRNRIRSLLAQRLGRHGIEIDEFSVTNFRFSHAFAQAIEAKTTADQLKLKANNDLERIKIEAEQKVTQARAEAEALKLQKQEVTAELIRLREIENQKLAIDKWDGKLPQTVASGAVPFIGVNAAR